MIALWRALQITTYMRRRLALFPSKLSRRPEGQSFMNTVCVLGLGYIGLPTAAMIASAGVSVLGVDVRREVVDTINAGKIHIEEPGLPDMVRAAVESGKLRAAMSPEEANVFIIAVPTPLTDAHKADMSLVVAAVRSLLPHLRPGNLVVLESTSPPGTCRDLLAPLFTEAGFTIGEDIFLAYCPERVLPGKIIRELVENDRIVGGMDPKSTAMAQEVYRIFVKGAIKQTSATAAEMIKLMENTFRDVNIALANEAACLCENLGVDFWEVARLANLHPRVHVHQAGPGVGGHCIAVDPWFLVEAAPQETALIQTARSRNDAMPGHVVDTVKRLVKGQKDAKAALLGLAYKADVDDIRESPSLKIAAALEEEGLFVQCYDPHVKQAPCAQTTLAACLEGADVVVLLTDHKEFKALDPKQAAQGMRQRILYDTRNALNHDNWREAGFTVTLLGSGLTAD